MSNPPYTTKVNSAASYVCSPSYMPQSANNTNIWGIYTQRQNKSIDLKVQQTAKLLNIHATLYLIIRVAADNIHLHKYSASQPDIFYVAVSI